MLALVSISHDTKKVDADSFVSLSLLYCVI